ncbi:MAG: carbohydrate kinase [Planctomycetes bacterium]|nr:carbohydrate kinase [Planctomycetota bacterium]
MSNINKPVTMSLGEVLWDVLPDGRELGGSPTNAAWHAAQLGADAHVVTAIGDDELGREAKALLLEKKLNLDATVVLPDKPTSTVDAILSPEGNATYVIHEDVAWDYLPLSDDMLALAKTVQGVNYGSLSQRAPHSKATTLAILDATPAGAIREFDINLRPPFIYREVLDDGLKRANVVKMNEQELPVIAKIFAWSDREEQAIEDLLQAYPNLNHAVITRGPDGAWWHNRKQLFKRHPRTCPQVVDTIGAGDSVTASVMMGLLKGWEEEAILEAALEIATFVCTQRGGMPQLPDELKAPFLT